MQRFMKKIHVILAAWFLCAVAGCSATDDLSPDAPPSDNRLRFSISAGLETKTRTIYSPETNRALWKKGDRIGVVAAYEKEGTTVFTDTYFQKFDFSTTDEATLMAEFTGALTDFGTQQYTYYAIYPFVARRPGTDISQLEHLLPTTQYPSLAGWDGACDFLISKPVTLTGQNVAVNGLELQYGHVFGFLDLEFTKTLKSDAAYANEMVRSVTLMVESGPEAAGYFTLDLPGAHMTPAADASRTVQLDYSDRKVRFGDLAAWFTLFPGRYTAVTLTVRTANYTMTFQRANLVIKAGSVSKASCNLLSGDKIEQEVNSLLPEKPAEGKTLNILLLGHSFGQDCTEYLPSLLSRAGIKNVYIARFYQGNCSLEEHYNHYVKNESYTFEYCPAGSTSWLTTTKNLQTAIIQTAWDIVIFQNSLENSGRYDTYQPYLDALREYIVSASIEQHGKAPVIGWNMFWPISKGAVGAGNSLLDYRLSFYDNSPEVMFTAYCDATREMMAATGIELIIPSGTAVENLRTTSLNTASANFFTCDLYHMSLGAGRYVAACTWFEAIIAPIYGVSCVGNTYRTSGANIPVTDHNAELIQRCAYYAVLHKFEITDVEHLPEEPDVPVDENLATTPSLEEVQVEWE